MRAWRKWKTRQTWLLVAYVLAGSSPAARTLFPNWFTIRQAFAVGFFQTNHRALPVCQKPRVVAMIKFRQIQRQVLFADMVKCANHSAL